MSANEHIAPIWSRSFSVEVDHGEGSYLYTTDGKRYLDFTCGIGVTNTGHAHPRVVRAIQEQAAKLIHGQANIVYHKPMVQLADELLTIVPSPLDCFYFSNSGAEIVEAGVKLAKHATGRTNVIVFQGSFHGRTHLTMAMTTSKTIYRGRYQPLVPGIFVAPYPYAFYYGWDEQTTLDFSLRELKKLLKTQSTPEETACIVVEPVLGEGGYVVPPPGFLPQLRKLCDEHGIMLVADEVQSGFGRTGKYFAVEHTQTVPDIMLMAKGIASGLPLSALAARKELMQRWTPGSHGGTFGGNVVACAAGVATIQAMREERMLENAVARGQQLITGLDQLHAQCPEIGEVRGAGLMVGVEFGKPGAPDTSTAKGVAKAAFERGLMLLTCGTFDNVIRWIPPLVVTEDQINEALGIFAAALDR
jgi:4-aminobutyrate aminotransferase